MKKWKVLFRRPPDKNIYDTMMPVIAPTRKDAISLALIGLSLHNLKNEDVNCIEIVSCTEII